MISSATVLQPGGFAWSTRYWIWYFLKEPPVVGAAQARRISVSAGAPMMFRNGMAPGAAGRVDGADFASACEFCSLEVTVATPAMPSSARYRR